MGALGISRSKPAFLEHSNTNEIMHKHRDNLLEKQSHSVTGWEGKSHGRSWQDRASPCRARSSRSLNCTEEPDRALQRPIGCHQPSSAYSTAEPTCHSVSSRHTNSAERKDTGGQSRGAGPFPSPGEPQPWGEDGGRREAVSQRS